MKKSTQAVRAGTRRDKNMGGLNTPLLSSSAIEYLDDSEVRYPRYFNTLNHDVVADKMSALECAEAGLITSSGMAAISAILFGLLRSGDHIVLTEGLYGGTHALIVNEFERAGHDIDRAPLGIAFLEQELLGRQLTDLDFSRQGGKIIALQTIQRRKFPEQVDVYLLIRHWSSCQLSIYRF